jgi:hypothetical protein
MYTIFWKLKNGEYAEIAYRTDLDAVVRLVQALRAIFPGEYLVKDAEGNNVDIAS